MIIQRVVGGLGNQMFQYAFIKSLALKKKCRFELDISSYDYYFRPFELDNFNIQKNYFIPFYEKINLNKKIKKFCYYIFHIIITHLVGYYHEKRVNDEFLMNFGKKKYFEGYFQSPKFFKEYENIIKEDFIPKAISKENVKVINKYKNLNTISIHIRRGDYLKGENQDFYKLRNSDYYYRAIKYMKNNIKDPIFLFFSDDMNWVKNKFKGKNYVYIDINKGKDSRQDLILMSNCKNNIIANSTFSWWGAYLNENPGKIIICPKFYMKNEFINNTIYPDSWIKF